MAGAKPTPRNRGKLERQLYGDGLSFAGVDEVGRGCLAGPVHAGCAVLRWRDIRRLPRETRALIRDSKQLSQQQRERIVVAIKLICTSWHVASATVEEINTLGIVPATFLAMRRAIAGCEPFTVLLVDGKFRIPGHDGRQETLIKGDNLCYSIAAASILAKTTRDAYMQTQSLQYPDYGFDQHVGYGTRVHLASIKRHGICPLHRKTFAPVRSHLELL